MFGNPVLGKDFADYWMQKELYEGLNTSHSHLRSDPMDNTDRKLMALIYGDPRMSLRELAKRVGISRQAAHRRIRALTKIGVFRRFTAEISVNYLNAPVVMIWGRSRTASLETTLAKLGESEFTACVRVAGGNELMVTAGLRSVSDLHGYVEFVKSEAEMPEPTVGLVCYGDGINPEVYDGGKRRQSYKKLSPLDLRIIASLQEDARKPTRAIAHEIGVSAKTVARHLDKMRSDGSLDFGQPLDATGEDMYTIVYVGIRPGADKVRVAKRLLAGDRLHVLFFRSFSNLPNTLLGYFCSDKIVEIRGVLKEIGDDDDVLSVTPNLLFFECMYKTWDQRLPSLLTGFPDGSKRPIAHLRARVR